MAYPLGVVGIIFTMIFIRYALRVKFEKEDEGLAALSREHKLADKVSSNSPTRRSTAARWPMSAT
ncbi:MAG: hypothetical protein ACLT1W_03870 [Alistipes onderdonkii]